MGVADSIATKRPTIMDVARACGLSKTTVSVILNDSPASARVPVETRERVRVAAGKLGYQPSWRGRALASRKTKMIGVLYTPPMPLVVRGNYEGILTGINEVLDAGGYHLLMVPLGEDTAAWGPIVTDQRMDGAIVLSRLREPLGTLVMQAKLPVTLVNADTELDLPCVLADDYGGALEATRHLIGLGHERIAFVAHHPPPHYSLTRRREGYEVAMREAGLGRHARTVDGTPEEIAEAVTTGPAGERPTGVVCYTHYLAVKLLQLWWERRVSVPGDLSMVTFSNAFPVEETIPPLTTMALPTEEMGRTAARMLLEQIEGATPPPPEVRRVVLRETLIVRKSAAAPKVAS